MQYEVDMLKKLGLAFSSLAARWQRIGCSERLSWHRYWLKGVASEQPGDKLRRRVRN